MKYFTELKVYLTTLLKYSPIDLKVYLGTLATFISYAISTVSLDVVKDIVTISVGIGTLSLTLYKLSKDISKDIRSWLRKEKKIKKS